MKYHAIASFLLICLGMFCSALITASASFAQSLTKLHELVVADIAATGIVFFIIFSLLAVGIISAPLWKLLYTHWVESKQQSTEETTVEKPHHWTADTH